MHKNFEIFLRRCETHSQCVSLAPPRAPLKLFLLHSIVFHMLLKCTHGMKKTVPRKKSRSLGTFLWSFFQGTFFRDLVTHTPFRLCFSEKSRLCLKDLFSDVKLSHSLKIPKDTSYVKDSCIIFKYAKFLIHLYMYLLYVFKHVPMRLPCVNRNEH